MIFLSAGVPDSQPQQGREYFGKGNIPAIREAVMALTRVCMEYHIPICFGGHPAISPLVYSIAKDYDEEFAENVLIYQSEWFKEKTPKVVSYYKQIVWTPKGSDVKSSVSVMRDKIFENDFDCGVFIGGMDGIIDEATRFHTQNPKSTMIAIPNTGGATSVLQSITKFQFTEFPDSYAYVAEFKKALEKYKK